jgi:galactose mutarotase-like enzyme
MHRLENSRLSLTIYPEYGARIDSFFDKALSKEWAWHPADYAGPRYRNDGSFDEHFEGGWEEVFPGDAETEIGALRYLDHGELWRAAWDVVSATDSSITLRCSCSGVPVDVRKTVELTETAVRLTYTFTNRSSVPIPFLFKLHPAIAIEAGDRISIPNSNVEPVDLAFSRIAREKVQTPFPFVKGEADRLDRIDTVRENDGETREFVYISDIDAGPVSVTSTTTGSTLDFTFDRSTTPFVWMLQSFGGWKSPAGESMFVLLIEPASTKPSDLREALENDTCAVLAPEEKRTIEFAIGVASSVDVAATPNRVQSFAVLE